MNRATKVMIGCGIILLIVTIAIVIITRREPFSMKKKGKLDITATRMGQVQLKNSANSTKFVKKMNEMYPHLSIRVIGRPDSNIKAPFHGKAVLHIEGEKEPIVHYFGKTLSLFWNDLSHWVERV